MTGVYADIELNSLLIASSFNFISCAYKKKMVKNVLYPIMQLREYVWVRRFLVMNRF